MGLKEERNKKGYSAHKLSILSKLGFGSILTSSKIVL